MLHNLWSDLRYSARRLSLSPGFSAAAIVTIALGIGVNTGIFTVLNGALFRDLPAPDAHELVSISQTLEGVPDRQGAFFGLFSTSEHQAYRDRTQTLSGVLGHSDPTRTTLGGESPQSVVGALVTCNYFDVLRQPPALGRGLSEEDCTPGASPVVVLAHELWTTTFAADPQILGRTVELNRQSLTVVGIAAEGTYGGFPYRTAYFAPISTQPLLLPNEDGYENDRNGWLFVLGRRNEGASLDQVRAELGVIAAQIDQQQPGRSTTLSVERAMPPFLPFVPRTALAAVVMSAFGLVLLIACANVANLLLARATARSREVAMRLSLGASRARLIQQLLAESVLISVAGGALGSMLALWSFQTLIALVLPSLSPPGIPPLAIDPSPDGRVLAVALALTFATGILCGLAPALHASKPDLQTALKQDSSGTGRGGRLQASLVGAQVALCMVLMIGAGLLLRGLHAAQTVDPGFAYRNVAVASYDLAEAGYDSARAFVLQRQLMEQVGAQPGVEAVGHARREPLSTQRTGARIRLPGQGENEWQFAERNEVTPNYFSVVGIPIVRGRAFTDSELTDDALVAIVSETTARRFWPDQDPIGQTLITEAGFELQVIGVARDAQVTRVGEIDAYYLYLPAAPRVALGRLELLVKSRLDFAATAAGIRAAVRALDPSLVVRVSPLEANLDLSRNLAAIVTTLAASLGALALVLAAVGIYGVVSYFVSRRFREIGIRMALGARSHDVLGLILKRTMRPVVAGATIGVVAALSASGILSSVLFGVSPVDLVGLGGAAAFVLGIAFVAGVLAGRPAMRADPTVTLRHE